MVEVLPRKTPSSGEKATPGDWAERLLPLAASLAICLAASRPGVRA